jgi:hypothetical protein
MEEDEQEKHERRLSLLSAVAHEKSTSSVMALKELLLSVCLFVSGGRLARGRKTSKYLSSRADAILSLFLD